MPIFCLGLNAPSMSFNIRLPIILGGRFVALILQKEKWNVGRIMLA